MGILDSVFGKKKDVRESLGQGSSTKLTTDSGQTQEERGKEAIKTEPIDDSISPFKSGVRFYNSGDYGKAEDEFRRILRVNPGHREARYYLGRIYEHKVQNDDDFETIEEAMSEYQEAIKIDPNYVDARIRLGGLYVKSGFYEGAMRELEEALRINPDSPEAHAAMGNACYTIGTGKEVKVEHPAGVGATSDFRGAKEYYKKAIEEFNRAIKLAPALSDKLQPLIERASQKVK
jgi:tetratricopeptide (TPR) repeat protein